VFYPGLFFKYSCGILWGGFGCMATSGGLLRLSERNGNALAFNRASGVK
jgi:hypothetical protein